MEGGGVNGRGWGWLGWLVEAGVGWRPNLSQNVGVLAWG